MSFQTELRVTRVPEKRPHMKFIRCAAFCLFGFLNAAFANGTVPATPLTYAHWNIGHFALGTNDYSSVPMAESDQRAREYRALINGLQADVIGCCEFDPVFDCGGGEATEKLFPDYDTKSPGPKNDYQCNAIFSRNLKRVDYAIVNYTNRFQPTYFIDATYLVNGREVHFVQTHLDWNTNAKATKARPEQIRQLIEYFSAKSHVVIAGDFNVYSASEYAPFTKAGYQLASCGSRGEVKTVQADSNPFRAIDNIIVKGFSISDVRLADEKHALSDHSVLLSVLEMLP